MRLPRFGVLQLGSRKKIKKNYYFFLVRMKAAANIPIININGTDTDGNSGIGGGVEVVGTVVGPVIRIVVGMVVGVSVGMMISHAGRPVTVALSRVTAVWANKSPCTVPPV